MEKKICSLPSASYNSYNFNFLTKSTSIPMQMRQSDWLSFSYTIRSAISVQWLEVLYKIAVSPRFRVGFIIITRLLL